MKITINFVQPCLTVAKVFLVVFLALLVLAWRGLLDNWFIPFAFLTGGIYSALAGFVGMKIATSANARTAQAASESLNKGLNVAFSSGAVMGFTVVGLGLLDISVWFHILGRCRGRCPSRPAAGGPALPEGRRPGCPAERPAR